MSFATSSTKPSVKPMVQSDKITAFVTIPSIQASQDQWTEITHRSLQTPKILKSAMRSKTRFLNRYAIFEAVETKPEDTL